MIKKLIYTLVLGLFSQAVFAQEGTEEKKGGEDLSATVTTIVGYRPTVSDAKKLMESPSTIDTTLAKPSPQYLYGNEPIETSFTPDSIQPAKMKGEPLDPLYRAYTRAGAGNGINYLADLYVSTVRSRNGALGLEVHGIGTQGLFKDVPPAPYNRWNGAVTGKKFLKKHAVDFRVGYDRERLQYYGYDLSDNKSLAMYNELIDQNTGDDKAIRNQFKQYYNRIDAGVGIKSFYTDSTDLNHTATLNYYNWSDRNAANRENNILLNASVSRYFGMHLFNTELLADLNFVGYLDSFNHNEVGTVAQSQNNNIIGLKPTMVSNWKKLSIEYGANIQLEIASSGTKPRIYPHLYAKYNLVKEIIIPYAGLTGGLKRNSMSSLTEQNPFLWASRSVLKNTNEVYRIYGGFRGAITDEITYNLQAARYLQRDAPLFVNYNASQYNQGLTRFGENYYVVNYDTLNVFEISGELAYRVGEKLQFVGSGAYYSYLQLEKEFRAWQRPGMEASISGFYQLKNKIIAKAELHFIGPRLSKSYDAIEGEEVGNDGVIVYAEKLNPVVDINIGVEYRYTERLSGFLNVNNMIAQRYQLWNQYPSQRINVLGGITYSFWKE